MFHCPAAQQSAVARIDRFIRSQHHARPQCAPTQAGSRAAVAEARAWQHNAAAWSERLRAAFPLYADLVQPLALAVLEVSAGLGLLADAAEGSGPGFVGREGGATAEAVVAQLMAFPPLAQGAAGVATGMRFRV